MNSINLLKLAAYLRSLPPDYDRFSMYQFHSTVCVANPWRDYEPWEVRPEAAEHPCGTSACAVGHGPAAGIPVLGCDQGWWGYSERAFGMYSSSIKWLWCFAADWGDFDNTPLGAAERIEFLVANGHPGAFPWLEDDCEQS